MRRLFIFACLLLASPILIRGQGGNTTVTATIKDPNGALYTNSQVNITFVEPTTVGKIPLLNGSTFQKQFTTFATDSFGKFSISLPDTGVIDSSSGTSLSQWTFRVVYSNGVTSFPYVTAINCAANIPATCTNNAMDISAQLQAAAAIIPSQAGGGGALAIRNIPCASTINFQMAGLFPTTSNTAFNVPLNCNVTSTSVTQAGNGVIQAGAIAQFTLIQDAIGGHSFAWPSNFIDQPSIQAAALQTTNASFWYDGTNWHAQTFPAAGGGGGGNPAGVIGDIQKKGVSGFAVAGINDNGTTATASEPFVFSNTATVQSSLIFNRISPPTCSSGSDIIFNSSSNPDVLTMCFPPTNLAPIVGVFNTPLVNNQLPVANSSTNATIQDSGILWSSGPKITLQNLLSKSANPATTGFLQIASTDTLNWRNNANNADLALGKNASDVLTWPNAIQIGSGGVIIPGATSGSATLQSVAIGGGVHSFPNNTGTVAEINLAQTFTANQTLNNSSQLRFLSSNGTNYAGFQGGASTANLIWLFPSSDSSGTQCLASNGSLQLSFTACSGGTGTPGGANTQVQYNNSGSFGGSTNLTWVSPALSIGTAAGATGQIKYVGTTSGTVTTQSQDAAGTWTFKWPNGAGTSGFPLTTDGTGVGSWTLLGLAGGGTNSGAGAFTNNQLVGVSGGALASLTGTLTGTNPVLTLTSAATGNVPFALNTPASPTADIFDININSSKTSWVDNTGVWHAPSYTASGTGALALSGTEGTCPATAAGIDILCIGNLGTHTIQSSLNGTVFKDITQWSNSGPTAHGVLLAATAFPQINSTNAGTLGQAFVSQGPTADGIFATLGANGGGTGTTTNTAHGVLVGEGTSAVVAVGPNATANLPLLNQVGADPIYSALPLSGTTVSGQLPIANGGTGQATLAAANIAVFTGAITPNDCVKWSSATVITDAGSTCGGAGGASRLDQITAATASNTINSTINPQIWNWALTGSTTAFKFGENTAATGSSNILLQASTLNTSTAIPFQVDNNGNGWQLSSVGLFKQVGTGGLAVPGTTHGLVVSEGAGSAIATPATGNAGQVLISNGASSDPSFQDPIVSQAFVNIWNAQDITVTRTSSNVRNPIFSQSATLQLTFASITGSPSGCTLQFRGVDSQGNVLNNGSTVSISPANGTTSQTFIAASTLQTAAQVSAVYACSAYPSAGTLTLDFTPIPNVNVTNTVAVSGTVTTTPPVNASTNLAQVAGTTTDTNSGTKSNGTIRVVIATDQPALTNSQPVTLQAGSNLAGEIAPVSTATTTDTTLRCTLASAASTNSTNCKASAGNIYGYRFVNTTTTIYYLRMYNSSSAPTCSSATGFIESIPIPPAGASGQAGGIVSMEPFGEGYTTGISFCFTGGSSSTDNTNAAIGVFGTILYK